MAALQDSRAALQKQLTLSPYPHHLEATVEAAAEAVLVRVHVLAQVAHVHVQAEEDNHG